MTIVRTMQTTMKTKMTITSRMIIVIIMRVITKLEVTIK